MSHLVISAGKSAVITGGASGIGLAAAIRFARVGMQVAIADLGADRLASARDQIAAAGARDVLAMEVVASFGRRRIGPTVAGAAFPAVLALADSLVTVGGTPTSHPHSAGATFNPYVMFRFYQQLETRIADGDIHWRDMDRFVAGPARYGRWMRYRLPQRDAAGHFDRLALAPLIDTIPSALHRAIGPGDYRFYAPSLDLTLHVVADTTREWLMLRSFVRAAADGYGIGEIEVWDDECRLIAYGTQAMYLQTVAGTPPVVDASRR